MKVAAEIDVSKSRIGASSCSPGPSRAAVEGDGGPCASTGCPGDEGPRRQRPGAQAVHGGSRLTSRALAPIRGESGSRSAVGVLASSRAFLPVRVSAGMRGKSTHARSAPSALWQERESQGA